MNMGIRAVILSTLFHKKFHTGSSNPCSVEDNNAVFLSHRLIVLFIRVFNLAEFWL
jgi:hypothetical protein